MSSVGMIYCISRKIQTYCEKYHSWPHRGHRHNETWSLLQGVHSQNTGSRQSGGGAKENRFSDFLQVSFCNNSTEKRKSFSLKPYFGNFLSFKVLLMAGEFKWVSPAFFLWTTGYHPLSSCLTYEELRIYLYQLKPSYWRLLKCIYNFEEIFFTVIYIPVTISYSSSLLPSSISNSPGNQKSCNFHKKESSKEAHVKILLQDENKKASK